MSRVKTKPLAVRIPSSLHDLVTALAILEQKPVRYYVEKALRYEIRSQLEQGDGRLREIVEEIEEYKREYALMQPPPAEEGSE